MSLTWNDLFLSGSIVDLATSKWRGRVRLQPKDLGIPDSDAVASALTLGTNRLAPVEAYDEINEIHARARRHVDHHSIPFGFVRGARYVPDRNIAELSALLKSAREDFDRAVEAFVSRYDEIKASQLPIITQALRDAARTTEAADAALARMLDEYPSADDVRKKFNLSWNVYAISGPRVDGAAAAMEDERSSVRSVVRDMIVDLRQEVIDKLGDVLSLIQKGGKLQQKSIDSALSVLDHIDRVNVLGDMTLFDHVGKLRTALNGLDSDARVSDAQVTGLQDIRQALSSSIEEAVAAAEAKLSSVGKRKLKVAGEKGAA